jgi:hypothetical protein
MMIKFKKLKKYMKLKNIYNFMIQACSNFFNKKNMIWGIKKKTKKKI